MTEPTTALRAKDNGLAVRVLEYLQARPGVVTKIETLETECGLNGEQARRGSIQRALADYAARNPKDLDVVSSGRAWAWRGATTAAAGAQVLKIIGQTRTGALVCEGPEGALYRAMVIE